jgi:PAS domain S-box-containing protein
VKKNDQRKISSIVFQYVTGFTLLVSIVLGLIYTYFEIKEFNTDSETTRNQFIELQKAQVKSQVEKAASYIHYTQHHVEDNMRTFIKDQVNSSWNIANNIYNESKGKYSKNQIKKQIKDALRPIRYYEGRGYIFIVNMDGVEELFPVNPQYEGVNMLNFQDHKGQYIIRKEIELIEEKGKGFLTDYWAKPGDTLHKELFPKTSYIRYFEPLDWYIGAGEYLDNVVQDEQDRVIEYIKNVKFGADGYIFINTMNGFAVVIDSDKYKPGDFVLNITDPNGVKVIEEEIKAAQKENGDFIYYTWVKPNSKKLAPKVSFIKGIPEWNWLIGSGVYLDQIDEKIAENRQILYKRLRNQLLLRTAIILIVIIVLLFVTRRISGRIENNISLFLDNLKKAVFENEKLNPEDYKFIELTDAGKNINKMVDRKKQIEDKLVESMTRFKAIFENVPVLLAVVDEEQNILFYNHSLKDLFNLNHNQQYSLDYFQNRITEKSPSQSFYSIFRKPEGNFSEFVIESKKGSVWQNWSFFKSNINEHIIVGYDVTSLKNSQAELAALNATKDKFFSIIAHDLKNPFNAVLGITEALSIDYHSFSDERRKYFIDEIHKSTESTFNLLQNLLNWARSQQGRIEVNKKETNIEYLIQDILDMYERMAKEKEIVINFESDLVEDWFIDYETVTIIISNLVNNAIKFSHMYSAIEIDCIKDQHEYRISVKDSGVGIPENKIQSLFKVNQVKSTRGTENEKGTGLGLLLCQELAELNNGWISIKSTLNKGTTFTLHLPLD